MDKGKTITNNRSANDLMNKRGKFLSILSPFLVFSEKAASSRYLKWMIMAFLPVMILLRYPVDRLDYDVWWQMALGKYYLTHHTLVMDLSVFSWTPTDPAWIYNTCLGSIVIYLFYNFLGGFGLWIFQWLIFLGIFLSFYLFLRLLRQRLDVTGLTIIAAIGIVCSIACRFYKPELFSVLFFCWTLFIFYCVKINRRKFLFYLYPLIFALWVNLHGAFVIGFCLLAGLAAGELLNRIFFPRESFTMNELVHLWSACFLSGLATLLNPYGIDYLLSIYNGVMSDAYTINVKYIQAYVSLWSNFKDLRHINVSFFMTGQVVLIMAIMMLILLGLFVYELIKKKSCDFTFLLITVCTYWGAMSTVRGIYILPLAFFFSFYYMLHRLNLKSIPARATILSLLVFILFFVNISYFTFRYGADNKWFGAGLDSFAPVKEVAFLKKYRLEGPVFNDYVTGGYLLWALYPDYKVFIDPRLGPFCKQVAPDYWEFISKPSSPAAIRDFTKKYPFKIALINYRELPLIFDFLKAGWRLLYFEQNAAVLIHESLLSRVPPEIRGVDLGPMRFRNVRNPEVLLNVFSLYVNLNLPASHVIYDIYKNNISDYYKPKQEHLRVMESDLRQAGLFL
ncbi:MAG: hypothetical protein CVU55_06795 [Deltaproteobacteria bacterium HGW-Deltaproteobacteria-13]|jgi:hypothetical protein|nr:MAG: hypothetical protein CVU55_06795 [Deltaproteobacteria bacterium HGW-Deltaproteobacteria-13]